MYLIVLYSIEIISGVIIRVKSSRGSNSTTAKRATEAMGVRA